MERESGRCSRPANPQPGSSDLLVVVPADDSDVAELAAVAAATFPLACPPSADPADIAVVIARALSADSFADYLADPDRRVFVARREGRIVGYTMLIRGVGDDPDIARAVSARPAVELSKMYVAADLHRNGAASALMQAGLEWAAQQGARVVWLGVNKGNQRARRFYAKHGFEVVGTRTFQLGTSPQDDFVMERPV